MKRLKVGIVVEPGLWREFKMECLKRGVSVPDMIEAAIELMLKKWKEEKSK